MVGLHDANHGYMIGRSHCVPTRHGSMLLLPPAIVAMFETIEGPPPHYPALQSVAREEEEALMTNDDSAQSSTLTALPH